MGLSRGVSRLPLLRKNYTALDSHGLAPWRFTFASQVAPNVRLHGQARGIWYVVLNLFVSYERELPRGKPVAFPKSKLLKNNHGKVLTSRRPAVIRPD